MHFFGLADIAREIEKEVHINPVTLTHVCLRLSGTMHRRIRTAMPFKASIREDVVMFVQVGDRKVAYNRLVRSKAIKEAHGRNKK